MIVNAKDWGNHQANGWYLTTWNGGASIQVVLSGNQSFQHDAGAQIFPLDAWVHVAMTFNSDTDARAIYINGSPVTTFVPNGWSVPNAITPTNPEFRLGLNMYGVGSLMPGELDDVGIWNGELDAVGVRALYSLGNNDTLRYNAATVRSLLAAYQAGTADDETPEIVISGVPWLKVSSGLGGSEGEVVALTALNWGLNLDNGAGMRTKIRKGTMIMVF
jgi:hypothetical protein